MKKYLPFIICFITICGFSQQKYQNLLWEISGNGLKKSSYLYGTMHVSKKIAFRLDDVFYEALDKSECIALESDPTTWLDFNYENMTMNNYGNDMSYDSNFYSELFKMSPANEFMVRHAIRFDNNLINGYLYRKDEGADNFEEETYLDMFIYQAGKKNGKPIVGLEDIAEANYLTTKAQANMMKKKPDPWVQKMFSEENTYMLEEDLYRERNLDLLDSIGSATNTNYYREHMLFIRNNNMVNVLDSLMQKKSVFAGVGAAHLPGHKGILNMLVEKGYTVKALKSEQTEIGSTKKEELENLFIKPNLSVQTTPDDFLSIRAFEKLREFVYDGQKFYVAPDMTNGAYLTITRLNTFEFLPNKNPITLESIDNLLYEDIPGDIIKKEKLTLPYPGISILNKTKKGDYQKYHIYKTPLEIIIIKFGGVKDYVLLNEKDIFDSLKFKKDVSNFEEFSSPYQKYSVMFPAYHISDNLDNSGKKTLQGVEGNDFYFLEESPVFETDYIEEDAFEAKYIHEKFLDDLDLKLVDGHYTNNRYKSYESSTKIDSTSSKKLFLKSVVKDESYYLLGYYGSNLEKASNYFKSFKIKNVSYSDFEKVTDTSLYFTVNSPTKAPMNFQSFYQETSTKPYDLNYKSTIYTTKANEQILVARTKFHDLHMEKNVDSMWNAIDKYIKLRQRFSKEKDFVISNKKKEEKDGTYSFSYSFKDSTSAKMVLVKHILKMGVVYDLTTLTDTLSQPSPFVKEFYDSFEPMDTLMGVSLFKDKTQDFFKALKNNDSIVLTGYHEVKFGENHAETIMQTLNTHEFSKEQSPVRVDLIRKLSSLKNPKIDTFLKELYLKSYSEPEIQSTILKTYLGKKDKVSYKTILELMESDLPLDMRNIRFLFRVTNDSLEVASELFPKVLQYASIEEYKEPIYHLLARVKDSNYIKANNYKRYKNQIITDGKIEIKRNLGKSSSNSFNKSDELETYVKLIFPFRKDKNAQDFFKKLLQTENFEALTTYFALLEESEETIPQPLMEKTLLNDETLWTLANKLDKRKLISQKYLNLLSQDKLAQSMIISRIRYNREKDSLSFITKKEVLTDKDEKVLIYFYELEKESEYGETNTLHYVSFIKPEDNQLVLKTYSESSIYGTRMDDYQTEDKILEEAIEKTIHKSRKRIDSGTDSFDF